jgi:starch synthase (maltosyl-transferring)
LRNLRIHAIDNDELIAFSKRDAATGDTVLVVCSVNPHDVREATTTLDLAALGVEWTETFTVRDLLDGAEYRWGVHNYVRLDPHTQPAHIFSVHTR